MTGRANAGFVHNLPVIPRATICRSASSYPQKVWTTRGVAAKSGYDYPLMGTQEKNRRAGGFFCGLLQSTPFSRRFSAGTARVRATLVAMLMPPMSA